MLLRDISLNSTIFRQQYNHAVSLKTEVLMSFENVEATRLARRLEEK